jgi:hypothetical protein
MHGARVVGPSSDLALIIVGITMMDLVYLVGPARVYARQVAVLVAPDLLALISGLPSMQLRNSHMSWSPVGCVSVPFARPAKRFTTKGMMKRIILLRRSILVFLDSSMQVLYE